ncbi:MFS transporter [Mucilaginibacter gynuensis]|uniref:MFS transporter n=1 Tax=Mucilaginibacter gynuensis TaxID=1302236 RepID=A0ABP8HES0_9SPHI
MKQPQSTAATPFTAYQKLLIGILALLQFTVILDFMVLSPLSDILMKSLNVTPAQFGWVVSVYAFSAGGSGLLAAGFADKFDRKKLLVFFYAGFILGTFGCAMATSYHLLLAARVVTGLFGGVIGAISMAVVTDIFELNQRGRVMGVLQMGFAGSQVLGIPIGLYFANLWGWHAPFLMIVGLAVLLMLVMVLKMQPVNKHLALQSEKNAFLHLGHTVSNSRYQTGFLATAFLSVGGFMLMPFGSAYLINNIHISQHSLPMVFLCTGISSIVIMPFIGKLSDKLNKFHLFTGGSILAIIMILIYTNLPPVPLWLVVVVNMIMFMGIMSRMIPATTLNTGIPEMADRGAYMSISSSLQQVAGGIGAVIAGLIVSQSGKGAPLQHYGTLGIVVAAVITACIFFVYRVSVMVQNKQREVVNVAAAENYDSIDEVLPEHL